MQPRLYLFLILIFLGSHSFAQTFFETAKDDAIINLRSTKEISQFKLNLTSTAISYGYYHTSGKAISKGKLLTSFEIKAKPNEDGITTLVKTGNLQPGLKLNGAIGYRISDIFKNMWSPLDISFKPEYSLTGYTIYDGSLGSLGNVYEVNKSTVNLNFLVNFGVALGQTNLFLGFQTGPNFTNNISDLDDGTVQTIAPVTGSTTQQLFSDVKTVKVGKPENLTKTPIKIDVLFDPNIRINLNVGTNVKLGFFAYNRTDGKLDKNRRGLGICFLNSQDPSKVFTTIGYEFPVVGKDVTDAVRKNDKGLVFFSIGYTIL